MNWFNPRFSPDGRRLALEIREGLPEIWVYDWSTDKLSRLGTDIAPGATPVWTPDGGRIAFSSARADARTPNLYWKRADGQDSLQRLTESPHEQQPASWHPSGRFLAFEESTPDALLNVMILPLEGDERSGWKPGKPTAFLSTPTNEGEPMFSPDGRWLAYTSGETGRPEVQVRPFPGPGGMWQISTRGGTTPTWSHAKHELFYTIDGQVMVVDYAVEGHAFRAEKPQPVSDHRHQVRGMLRMFDLHPDGERFVLAPAAPAASSTKLDSIVVLFNFFDELRRIAPTAKP